MNYNDEILENKTFNFFKQLMYNLALAICIMLVGVLVMVYGFKFRLYEVLSDSQAPYFVAGDMVVVKPQTEYKVGDIIKFDISGELPTTHRLLAIKKENGKTYYICHGDNVQSANPTSESYYVKWEEDSEYINNLIKEGKSLSYIQQKARNIQTPNASQVEGKVVAHADNYGTYFKFIKSHYMLLISIVAGIWCFSSVVQNEIDMKKCRRLF